MVPPDGLKNRRNGCLSSVSRRAPPQSTSSVDAWDRGTHGLKSSATRSVRWARPWRDVNHVTGKGRSSDELGVITGQDGGSVSRRLPLAGLYVCKPISFLPTELRLHIRRDKNRQQRNQGHEKVASVRCVETGGRQGVRPS